MRHPAFLRNTDRSVMRAGRSAILAIAIGGGVLMAPVVVAQDATPAPSPIASPAVQAEAQITPLMQTSFNEFVPAPMTVRMLRITIQPGASTPMHTHPGPEFDLIEKGELTIRTEGDATITRASGDAEVATTDKQILEPNDWVVYQPGTGMFYENASEEPVVLLSAVLLPVGADYPESITYTDGQPTSKDFEGVAFTVLGDGLVQKMPKGTATVSIDAIMLPAGADLPATDGVAMYSQVKGNFSFIVDSGAVQVSRTKLQSLQPNAVTGEEFILEPGDAAFFPAGVSATSRADETGEVELLSLEVTFDEPITKDAASLTFTSGSSASGDATGGADAPASTPVAESSGVIGDTVTTSVDDLNLRAQPSTEADVVDQLAAGIELEIIGGPEEAEGYTWYEVQVTSEGGSSGWVAADFLEGLDVATAEAKPTETPDAEGTPAAQSSDTIAKGSMVATTVDSVRVRAEGNLGGDIVNAYPTGTEFEVTGDPVDADNFTWYPVTLVENPDVSGWIPADFIQQAP